VKNAKWHRVNKRRRCEICGHDTWCTYSPALDLILCMRVESDKPSNNSMGGWLHGTNRQTAPCFYPPVKAAVRDTAPDFSSLLSKWQSDTDRYLFDGFAMSLGVDTDALRSTGCAWNGREAWAFPMRDANRKVVGIRLRNNTGQKWAVTGSHAGLFYPNKQPDKRHALHRRRSNGHGGCVDSGSLRARTPAMRRAGRDDRLLR